MNINSTQPFSSEISKTTSWQSCQRVFLMLPPVCNICKSITDSVQWGMYSYCKPIFTKCSMPFISLAKFVTCLLVAWMYMCRHNTHLHEPSNTDWKQNEYLWPDLRKGTISHKYRNRVSHTPLLYIDCKLSILKLWSRYATYLRRYSAKCAHSVKTQTLENAPFYVRT